MPKPLRRFLLVCLGALLALTPFTVANALTGTILFATPIPNEALAVYSAGVVSIIIATATLTWWLSGRFVVMERRFTEGLHQVELRLTKLEQRRR